MWNSYFQLEYIGCWSQTRDSGFPLRKQLPRSTTNSSVNISTQVTNIMQQTRSWDADPFSATLEIPVIL